MGSDAYTLHIGVCFIDSLSFFTVLRTACERLHVETLYTPMVRVKLSCSGLAWGGVMGGRPGRKIPREKTRKEELKYFFGIYYWYSWNVGIR